MLQKLLESIKQESQEKDLSYVISLTNVEVDAIYKLDVAELVEISSSHQLSSSHLILQVNKVIELPQIPDLITSFRQDAATPSIHLNVQSKDSAYVLRVKDYQYVQKDNSICIFIDLYDFDYGYFNIPVSKTDEKKLSSKRMKDFCKHFDTTKDKLLSLIREQTESLGITYYPDSKVIRKITLKSHKLIYVIFAFKSYRSMEKCFKELGIYIEKISNKELTINF